MDWMKVITVAICFVLCAVLLGCKKELPPGASSVTSLSKDGEYHIVRGPDLKNLDNELISKLVRFDGRISRKTALLKGGAISLDGVYYVRFTWVSNRVPKDMSEQLSKGGLQKNDRIRVWGRIDFVDEGAKREGLIGPSCHVTVQKWQRLN